jgi:hypothetical protein
MRMRFFSQDIVFFSDGVNFIPTCAIGFVFASFPTPSPPHPAEQASATSFAGQLAVPSHQARVQSPYLSRSSFKRAARQPDRKGEASAHTRPYSIPHGLQTVAFKPHSSRRSP